MRCLEIIALWSYNNLKPQFENKNWAVEQKLGLNLKVNEFLVDLNSLGYDKFFRRAQILTILVSLHSALMRSLELNNLVGLQRLKTTRSITTGFSAYSKDKNLI